MTERAEIVAWLRRERDKPKSIPQSIPTMDEQWANIFNQGRAYALTLAADRVERGEHMETNDGE